MAELTPLACSVRGCGAPLARRERVLVCSRGHSYDVARSGYVNLLQPQDRRSRSAGDSKEQVAARARLLAARVGQATIDALVRHAARLDLGDRPHVVDLGCGSGEALAALAAVRTIDGIGIDLSTAAATCAARRFPALTWLVANADRRLPLTDRTIALVLSLHGRRNPVEVDRILVPDGHLLAAVPARDDLVELRTLVQGTRVERDRGAGLMAAYEPLFRLVEQFAVRDQLTLGRESLIDLLRGTYRGERRSAAGRIEGLEQMQVTVAAELFLFARRPRRGAPGVTPGRPVRPLRPR
jgi:23S rRNA (guanine745-N1)-methyltransferase